MQYRYYLKEISTSEMDLFLEQTKQASFTQSGAMAELTIMNGNRAVCLALYERAESSNGEFSSANQADDNNYDKIVMAGMFMFKKILRFFQMAVCLAGPVANNAAEEAPVFFLNEVKKYLKKQGVIYLALNPWIEMGKRNEDGEVLEAADWSISQKLAEVGFRHYGMAHEDFLATPRWIFVKELVDSEGLPLKGRADLLKSYSVKTRNNIKKAEKNLVYVETVGKERIPEFLEILNSTAERRGFHNRGRQYFENFLEAFGDRAEIRMAFFRPLETLAFLQQNREELLADKKKLQEKAATSTNKKYAGRLKELENQIGGLENSIAFVAGHLGESDVKGASADLSDVKGASADLSDVKDASEDQVASKNVSNSTRNVTAIPRFSEQENVAAIPISAALFITFGGEMVYFLSGSLEEYFSLCGSDLIQLEAQLAALKKGIRRYNFFGTFGAYSGNSDDGVYKFKKSFGGGRVVELPGMYYCPLRPILGKLVAYKMRAK